MTYKGPDIPPSGLPPSAALSWNKKEKNP